MKEAATAGSDIKKRIPVEETQLSDRQLLEEELADARLLHRLSIELIQEDGIEGLYNKIVEAAVAIMRSQFATIQMLFPEKGSVGKLRLLACSGFKPEEEKFWEWVYSHTGSSCGQVLKTQKRSVITDYRNCEFMRDEPTLQVFLDGGILAAQSTPLFSRNGKLLGMISTHWDRPYDPPTRHLELLDILARQAADLIERTNSLEALKELEERQRALAAATNDIFYRTSADWVELQNLKATNLLDYTVEPETGWLERHIPEEDRAGLKSAIETAIQNKSIFQHEHRVWKEDGSTQWLFSRAIPIINQEGEVTEWFGAASDITEKRALLLNLETLVAERTKELQRSNEDLQQFAHVASHDLKEPVRKIRTFGLRLKDELAAEKNNLATNDKSKGFADKILQSADRMSTMIEGVLNYSLLEGSDHTEKSIDLNQVFADITNDLEVLIAEKKAVITWSEMPPINGDPILIYQLFYNLVNNSLKFSKEGIPPTVNISSKPKNYNGNAYLQISLADNGIGFDPQFNDKIFSTFTRLNSKSRYEGTGLGLSLSKKIVERHKGVISAQGEENAGCTIKLTLPAND